MNAVDAGAGSSDVDRLAGAVDRYDRLIMQSWRADFDPVGLLEALGEVCRESRALVRTQDGAQPRPLGDPDA